MKLFGSGQANANYSKDALKDRQELRQAEDRAAKRTKVNATTIQTNPTTVDKLQKRGK